MAVYCDETGYVVRIEITKCVRTERLNLEAPEGRVAAKLLYLGPAEEERFSGNPYYGNDLFMLKAVWSPWTEKDVPAGNCWGTIRDGNGVFWLTYWNHFGIRAPSLSEKGLLLVMEVPDIVAVKQGTMKVFLNDTLLLKTVLDREGEQRFLIPIEEATAQRERYLKESHHIQEKLLTEFLRVAEKYGIQYYLFCGGLIGALRNKGPIPWDDDLDIALPRKSFQKLKDAAKKEWGANNPDFRFLNYRDYGKNLFLDYMVRLACLSERTETNTFHEVEEVCSLDLKGRLALDFYLLELAPSNVALHRLQCGLIRLLYTLSLGHRDRFIPSEHRKSSEKEQRIAGILAGIGRRLPLGVLDAFYKWAVLFGRPLAVGKDRCYFQANGYHRCYEMRFPVSWFGRGRKVPFGNLEVLIPDESEKILRHMYGSYDQYPAPAERIPSHWRSEDAG